MGSDVTHRLQEAGLGREDALHRFHDDAGQLVVVLLYDLRCDLNIIERGDQYQVLYRLGDACAVGNRVREVATALAGGDAHQGIVVAAVEPALELENLLAPAIGAGHTHGLEGGVGSRGSEADLLGAGDGLHYLFGQHYGAVIGGEECAAFSNRIHHGFGHRRVGMTQYHRPGPQQVVDKLTAAHVPHMGATAPLQEELSLRLVLQVSVVSARQVTPSLFQELHFLRGTVCHERPFIFGGFS